MSIKNQKRVYDHQSIEVKQIERIERKYKFMMIEVYSILRKVEVSLEDEENLDLYMIDFRKEIENYLKLKRYQNGCL